MTTALPHPRFSLVRPWKTLLFLAPGKKCHCYPAVLVSFPCLEQLSPPLQKVAPCWAFAGTAQLQCATACAESRSLAVSACFWQIAAA